MIHLKGSRARVKFAATRLDIGEETSRGEEKAGCMARDREGGRRRRRVYVRGKKHKYFIENDDVVDSANIERIKQVGIEAYAEGSPRSCKNDSIRARLQDTRKKLK